MSYVLFYEGEILADSLEEVSVELWRGSNEEISDCCRIAMNRIVQDVTFVRFTDTGETDSRIARLFYDLQSNGIERNYWLRRFIAIGLSRASLFGCIELGMVADERASSLPAVFAVDPSQSTDDFVQRLRDIFRENTTIEFLVSVEK